MAVAEPVVVGPPRRLPLRPPTLPRALRRVSRLDRISIYLLVGMTALAAFAPLIAPYSSELPAGPSFKGPFSGGFILGTDDVGRDIFSRVLLGMRSTWFAAIVVILSGVVIGGLIGLAAGAAGGWVDSALMRFTDIFLAMPGPILAIAVVAALGPSLQHLLIAVAIVWWPFYARIVRGEVRALAARPHLEAARLAGAGRFRLAFRHLLPGALPSVVVTASLDVGALILTLASLSFLGLGAPAPKPELGAMSFRGLDYLFEFWWVPIMPAIAVMVMTVIANLSGDGVRDLLGDR
jgi:peptide/nickel transport system permease protein